MSSTISSSPGGLASTPALSIVNLAARQRMLSQRLILQTVLAVQGRTGMAQKAQQSLDTFVRSQATLVDVARGLNPKEGAAVKQVYFGSGGVETTVQAFIQDARAAIELATLSSSGAAIRLDRLLERTDGVLAALNLATEAIDALSSAREREVSGTLRAIVGDIQSVAREAKVVSFNAQVMAARAGTAGREFAVVASVLANISTEIDTLAKKGVELARAQ
ncbi:methyl-accepting chemotaxis protein [Hydrogenophaga sp. OTU3427]|uniref:methyl-accepting chemotaxis protein n=1 Tax=Hydrogenophaga sp. OTU3427 TaxID=3043856 RepID=UPI00313C1107